MSKYELILIVDATLQQDEKESITTQIQEDIGKCDGKVINTQVWLDKHKFSFRIKNRIEGTYFLINFESERNKISKLRGILRLNEKILRFLIVRGE